MRKPSELAITVIAILALIIAAIASVLISHEVKAQGDDGPLPAVAPSPGDIPPLDTGADPAVPSADDPSATPSADESPDATAAPDDPSSPPSETELDVTAVSATSAPDAAAQNLVEQLGTVLPQEGGNSADLQLIATEALADQLQVLADEYEDYGWTASGHSQVLSVEVNEKSDEEFQVLACIDSSGITVTDAGGNIVNDPDIAPTFNEYTMKREGERWVLTDQTFPENPDCA